MTIGSERTQAMTNKTSGIVVKIPAPATHKQTIGVLITAKASATAAACLLAGAASAAYQATAEAQDREFPETPRRSRRAISR